MNASLFINANRVNSFALIQVQCVSIDFTNGGNARFELRIFFVFAGQPVLVLLRTNRGASQKFIDPA